MDIEATMSACGLRVGRWVLVLCIALTLTACGNSITADSGVDTGGKPHLTVEPQSGTQNTRIAITGRAFPPQQPVRLTLEWAGERLDIGEVMTDGSGAFILQYVISKEITERHNVAKDFDITASTVGNTASANVRYRYVPEPAIVVSSENTRTPAPADQQSEARPSVTLNPAFGGAKSRIQVSASGFPPDSLLQVQVGVPGSGLVTQVLVGEQANADGNAQVYVEIPEFWEDGRMVVEPVLVVLVKAQDDRSNASATFNHTISPAVTGTSDDTLTATVEVSNTPTGQTATVEATTSDNADAIQTAIDFLTSLLRDPTGQSSVAFLSERLRSEITSDWVLPTGIGIQPGFISFEVVLVSNKDDVAQIQATLSYEMGASVRDFALVVEDGKWRIDNVTAGSRED